MTVRPAPSWAAVGHQEDWHQLQSIVARFRGEAAPPVSLDDLKSLLPHIPPRTVSRFSVGHGHSAAPVEAIYVDALIAPEALAKATGRALVRRVEEALAAAEREGARLATLGGFTSILYELRSETPATGGIAVTTGNSLTAALIVRGLERAAELTGRDLASETLLVVGASGDVGSACARLLAGSVRRLLLAGRNSLRLEQEANALARSVEVHWSTDVPGLQRQAGLVIAAASAAAPMFRISDCCDDAIVCDAGYPKNIHSDISLGRRRLFWGGMGQIAGGFPSHDGVLECFYRFPAPMVAHGCILEGAVLALAERFEPFSWGRGNIQPPQVEAIWTLACAHGVSVSPLFNADGIWPEELTIAASELVS